MLADLRRVFFVGEWTSEDERQRGSTDLRDIGPAIEMRHAERLRQRDTQPLPVPFVRVAKLLDRRAEHVLDEHEAPVRRDDDALRADRRRDRRQAPCRGERQPRERADAAGTTLRASRPGANRSRRLARIVESLTPGTWSDTTITRGTAFPARSTPRTRPKCSD